MSNSRSPITARDEFLARFDHLAMGERKRERAKAQYLQIEAVLDGIWSLGARITRGIHGSGR